MSDARSCVCKAVRAARSILDDYRVSDLAVVMDETPDDDTESPVIDMAGAAARA